MTCTFIRQPPFHINHYGQFQRWLYYTGFTVFAPKHTLWLLLRKATSILKITQTVCALVQNKQQKLPHLINMHVFHSSLKVPVQDETYNSETSEYSDQPAHPCSLIRVFTDYMCLLQPPDYPKRNEWEPLLYWVDVQADLSLCWFNMSYCKFWPGLAKMVYFRHTSIGCTLWFYVWDMGCIMTNSTLYYHINPCHTE